MAKSLSAVGIPDRTNYVDPPKITEPKIFLASVHRHIADRAGDHRDLRLGDPKSGITYNWAGKKWPKPGEGTYYIAQPTHDFEYLKFQGEISKGYGKGKVSLERHEPTEVVSSTPERVAFNLYKGRVPEQYVLRKVDGKKWVLHNTTPTRDNPKWDKLVPPTKPKYREKSTDWLDFSDDNQVMQAKIDGASNYLVLKANQPMRVFSYREAKSTPTRLIEHTQKLPNWHKNIVPKELDNTVLRAEIYAKDRKGRALKEKDIGAILNTSTLASREKQQRLGELVPAAFNVERFRGRDVASLPYETKLKMIQEAASKIPGIELPPTARTPLEKQLLFQRIQRGQEKLTREGVVTHELGSNKTTKIKFRPDFDLYIRSVNESTVPGQAGSLSYSLTPRGPVVGTVGSGFTQAQRKRMLDNPEDYIGRVARVKAEGQFDSGALRVPTFKSWHTEKSQEKMFKESADIGVASITDYPEIKQLSSGLGADLRKYVGSSADKKPWYRRVREDLALGGAVLRKKVLLAQEDDKPVGYVKIHHRKGSKAGLIDGLYVDPEHRGTGVGKDLLGAALKDLKSRGAGEVYLNVFTKNPAKQLYKKTGFQPHSEYMRALLRKEAKVRKRKGKYEVLSSNGRILGRHVTEELARRQEKAIWARRRQVG